NRHDLQMSGESVGSAAGFTFTARRNDSLPPGGRFLVPGSLALVLLAISSGFALNGAWLVFPFAGLDVLVVFLAFRYLERRGGDCECLTLDGDRVVVEIRRGARLEKFEFNRHWVQVLHAGSSGTGRSRLALRSHGKEVEFGVHLDDEQRA